MYFLKFYLVICLFLFQINLCHYKKVQIKSLKAYKTFEALQKINIYLENKDKIVKKNNFFCQK